MSLSPLEVFVFWYCGENYNHCLGTKVGSDDDATFLLVWNIVERTCLVVVRECTFEDVVVVVPYR